MQKLFEFFCQLTKMLWLSDVSTSERQWALLLFQTVWMHLKSSLFLCVCVCVCVCRPPGSALSSRHPAGSEPPGLSQQDHAAGQSRHRPGPAGDGGHRCQRIRGWVPGACWFRLLDQKKKQDIIHMFRYLIDSSSGNWSHDFMYQKWSSSSNVQTTSCWYNLFLLNGRDKFHDVTSSET